MKLKHLFLAALAVLTITACGSKESKKTSEPTTPDVEVATIEEKVEIVEQVVESGNINMPSHIVISKESMTLKLYDLDGKIIYNFPVAVGKSYGQKQKSGDMRTPEGVFSVQQIQNASTWSHDFKDGKGNIEHAYGDWFIRLLTPPHKGIGIHGTHAPESIGTRATEGCIRLHNENLNKLKPLVKVGMKVIIETSKLDMEADGKEGEVVPVAPTAPAAPTQEVQPVSDNVAVAEDKPSVQTEQQPATEVAPGEIIEHKIESGQYISHIAVKYHTTKAKIMELNPGLDPDKIRAGQVIKVQPNTDGKPAKSEKVAEAPAEKPAEKVTAPAADEDPNGIYHQIASGDNFHKLAQTYGTSPSKIQELNPGLDPTKLQIGQRIRVK